MSDMYGAVSSNGFKVKDVDAFRAWFVENCYFGDDTEIFVDDNVVAFGGYEQYPSAYPRMPSEDEEDTETPEWDLQAFAAALREHLAEPQEVVVVAAGHEKLRYVGASVLIIPAQGPAVYFNAFSDDNALSATILQAARELRGEESR